MTEDELSKKLDDKLRKESETVSQPEPKFKISEADIYKSVTSQQDGDAWLFYQIYRPRDSEAATNRKVSRMIFLCD